MTKTTRIFGRQILAIKKRSPIDLELQTDEKRAKSPLKKSGFNFLKKL